MASNLQLVPPGSRRQWGNVVILSLLVWLPTVSGTKALQKNNAAVLHASGTAPTYESPTSTGVEESDSDTDDDAPLPEATEDLPSSVELKSIAPHPGGARNEYDPQHLYEERRRELSQQSQEEVERAKARWRAEEERKRQGEERRRKQYDEVVRELKKKQEERRRSPRTHPIYQEEESEQQTYYREQQNPKERLSPEELRRAMGKRQQEVQEQLGTRARYGDVMKELKKKLEERNQRRGQPTQR